MPEEATATNEARCKPGEAVHVSVVKAEGRTSSRSEPSALLQARLLACLLACLASLVPPCTYYPPAFAAARVVRGE